jgi:3',5'-cyclic-AMP phosphodiesterase
LYKFLFLDSSSAFLSLPQLQWMKDELETEKKVVLFIHHPVLEVDIKVDKLYPLQNRNDVLQQLTDNEREITIFCGHYHLADEQYKGRIRQIISPAISFQMLKSAEQMLVDGSQFGYRIISFHDDGTIETTVKTFQNESAQSGVTAVQ